MYSSILRIFLERVSVLFHLNEVSIVLIVNYLRRYSSNKAPSINRINTRPLAPPTLVNFPLILSIFPFASFFSLALLTSILDLLAL